MSHLFDFCFRVFQRGVSVEEFWDTKSQIMGESGLGLLLGISGSEGAKVYHIWDGANVSRRSITDGVFLEIWEYQYHIPPFTLQFVVGRFFYTTVYYHMTNQISFRWKQDDEMNMREEKAKTILR